MNMPSLPANNVYAYLTTIGIALILFAMVVPQKKESEYLLLISSTEEELKIAELEMAEANRQLNNLKELYELSQRIESKMFFNYEKDTPGMTGEQLVKFINERFRDYKRSMFDKEDAIAKVQAKRVSLMASVDQKSKMIEARGAVVERYWMLGKVCVSLGCGLLIAIIPWWKEQRNTSAI